MNDTVIVPDGHSVTKRLQSELMQLMVSQIINKQSIPTEFFTNS